MHNGMKLEEMLAEVIRHSSAKSDYITNTKENLAIVNMPDAGFENDLAVVVQNGMGVLERFGITENFHNQVAARLKIPSKYYQRLLGDHRDLLLSNINTLFQREPELRMIRTLDGKARAFLSNSFRRVDNEQILEKTLPVIRGDFDTTILSTGVDENRMRFKCLFNGDTHKVQIGETTRGKPDFVNTGFEMGNSEVGKGSFYIRGFFYRSFCLNGCVFGTEETASFKQVHVGSRLGVSENMLLSNETMRKEDELIISAARDVLTNLAAPEFTHKLADKLIALKNRKGATNAAASVEAVCKELRLSDGESASVLESFIKDQDYSQWGMVNAVTEQANKTDDYNRASKFEEYGNKIINLPAANWTRIASLEKVAA